MRSLNPQKTCKPVRNPMDKYRSPTDTMCLYIFVVTIAAWFIMNCTYLLRGKALPAVIKVESFMGVVDFSNEGIITLPKILHQCDGQLIIFIGFFGSIIILILLKTLNCLSKFWAVLVLTAVVLIIVCLIFTISLTFPLLNLHYFSPAVVFSSTYLIIKAFVAIIFLVASINATCTVVTLDGLAEIIKKISYAVFSFPALFLFGFIIAILSWVVIAFTALSADNIDNTLSATLNLLGGIYLIDVIWNFSITVISQCISTWHCSQNKEELSGCIILKSIGLIGRNHIGSIAFTSTRILPVILSIYILCMNKFPSPPNSGFKACLVKWMLILDGFEYTSILTASYGLGVHDATKKVYSLFTRNCAIVLSVVYVFWSILVAFILVALLISVGVAANVFPNSSLGETDFVTIKVMGNIGIILFIAVLVIAEGAGNTVLVNTVEEIEETKNKEMNEIKNKV